MSLFRRLGRRYEFYRQVVKKAASEVSNSQCQNCGARLSDHRDRCSECGYQPPHEVLDVDQDASEAVVKTAAREKIKEVHPDQGGSSLEFQRVKQARDRLLNQ